MNIAVSVKSNTAGLQSLIDNSDDLAANIAMHAAKDIAKHIQQTTLVGAVPAKAMARPAYQARPLQKRKKATTWGTRFRKVPIESARLGLTYLYGLQKKYDYKRAITSQDYSAIVQQAAEKSVELFVKKASRKK